MGYGQMAETYFQNRPDVLRVIEDFGKRRELSLFKRLGQDQNNINFLSWLAEMKFGIQFDKMASAISYDRKIDGQRPDWFIEANRQEIIAEVARINLDETEMLGRVSEFVSPSPATLGLVATSSSKSLHSQYFFGALGKIERKEEVYRDLIKRRAIPFIICIDCSTLDLFIFENDVHDFFIADGKQGHFFAAPDFGENVTGILFRDPYNQYTFFNNPRANNQLEAATLSFFNATLPGIF
jgi:hypothetical protein